MFVGFDPHVLVVEARYPTFSPDFLDVDSMSPRERANRRAVSILEQLSTVGATESTSIIQRSSMPAYRLDIEYDGTDWHGWQTQPDHPTIQRAIEEALAIVLREKVSIVGSGRTDAGVHALGQVAHMRLDHEVDPFRLCGSLNGLLPESVAVRSISTVSNDFHARFNAVKRTYHYRIVSVPIAIERRFRWYVRPKPDFGCMNDAAKYLLGAHNYSSFCRTASETRNRECCVSRAEWIPDGRDGESTFIISADRYLHGMVRSIVGALIEIGHGKGSPGDIETILAAEDRTAAGLAAPAKGLFLHSVLYPGEPS